jgi:outer membrane lipoprotein-sorting protein
MNPWTRPRLRVPRPASGSRTGWAGGATTTLALATLLLAVATARTATAPDATSIVRRADQHLRGTTSYAEYTMTLVRPDWSREMTLKSWTRGHDAALILIESPARDRGTSFLKRGAEVWSWVPAVERVIKIPPSMMTQSWMGSDFTNDDLVKESSLVDDYTHEIVGDSTIAGRTCWKVRLVPKPEAAVVWGRVLLWVSEADDLELRLEYFDEDGALVNVLEMSSIRELGGRLLPTVLTMSPVGKPGQHTVLTYRDARFDQPIADPFFSEQNMRRVR